jgi:Zn ribbon nucleic-acid-binding protein
MAGMLPRTYHIVLIDTPVADLPPLTWFFYVHAVCPSCKGLADLGGTEDGKAVLTCPECGWRAESQISDPDDVVTDLLRQRV